jgi:regulator of sirC expression with transglutaminase-like and TPR domain
MTSGNVPLERLSMLCARPEKDWDLAEAALLISLAEYPELDPRDGLAALDLLAQQCTRAIARARQGRKGFTLARFLCDEEGFNGNFQSYDDPANSYLSEVLRLRTGLPILLSLLYCEVGRRAGLSISGVGLPGHFIVRIDEPEPIFLDPFNGGRRLEIADCATLVEEIFSGELRFRPDMLHPSTPREFLTRILRNLKGVYLGQEDLARARRLCDFLVCATPDDGDELRDRGLLSLQAGDAGAAVNDLTRYLQGQHEETERKQVVEALRSARRSLASLN